MRIIANIPHPQLKISIFLYNEKYIIEMEAAQYKQSFKISADSISGVDEVKALVTPELINQDCYGAGWMMRVQPAAGAGADLLGADAYAAELAAVGG